MGQAQKKTGKRESWDCKKKKKEKFSLTRGMPGKKYRGKIELAYYSERIRACFGKKTQKGERFTDGATTKKYSKQADGQNF